jgi:hypothetical protein
MKLKAWALQKRMWLQTHAKIRLQIFPHTIQGVQKNKRLEPFHMRQHMHGMTRVILQPGKYNAYLMAQVGKLPVCRI